jgi:hypothetical protein
MELPERRRNYFARQHPIPLPVGAIRLTHKGHETRADGGQGMKWEVRKKGEVGWMGQWSEFLHEGDPPLTLIMSNLSPTKDGGWISEQGWQFRIADPMLRAIHTANARKEKVGK